ncbi:MAG: hypothetical protein MRY64_13165 [Hyphomonadaceae bacterium]|nr:hypothetical protein [Hyphomonadaceae bacterium]
MIRSAETYAIFSAAVFVLGACAGAPPVPVASGAAVSDLVVRASGAGDWEVACSGVTQRGRSATAEMDGRGSDDHDVIVIRDAVSASCTYAAGDAPLTLTLPEAEAECPFDDVPEDICRVVFAANASGSFEFSPE